MLKKSENVIQNSKQRAVIEKDKKLQRVDPRHDGKAAGQTQKEQIVASTSGLSSHYLRAGCILLL
jgi:hypothetical protein